METSNGRASKKGRIEAGKKPKPSYAIIDSRSSKTTLASENVGFDGGKKVKGRKWHTVVDTLGHILAVFVHAANIHDTKSGIVSVTKACGKYQTIERFCADAGYRKSFENNVLNILGLGVDISLQIKQEFEVLPKRWVVERTFAWLNNSRRLSKDYERKTLHQENMIYISHLQTLLRRY